MTLPPLVRCCCLALLSPLLLAQEQAGSGNELRRAFVDADGGRRLVIAAAADALLAADPQAQAAFVATLRAIAAVAPARQPAPEGGGPAAKAPELTAAQRQLMAAAIDSDPAAQKAALASLAADAPTGAQALQQLDERGRAVLARAVSTFVRKQLETGAIYAGQYSRLRAFHPEGTDLLLRWAREAPREAPNPEAFRTACLRALRDVLRADQATDALRGELRELATKAQAAHREEFFLEAVCALRQFGDSAPFDGIRTGLLQQRDAADPEQRLAVLQTLANLHYAARLYAEAAGHYQAVVAALEAKPGPIPGLPTLLYNTACNLALAGQIDEAFAFLGRAVDASLAANQPLAKALLDTDHDIDKLRPDPRFWAICARLHGKRAEEK
jgi:tetratricopeptide (TPR) repeat protein